MIFHVMPDKKPIYIMGIEDYQPTQDWSEFVTSSIELTAKDARILYYKKHKMRDVYGSIRSAIECGERQVIIDIDMTIAEILRSDGYAIRCVNSEEFDNRTTGYVVSW